MNLNKRQILDSFLFALSFLPQTLLLVFVPFAICTVFGLLIAFVRVMRTPVLSQLLTAVVAIFKGIPIYLFMVVSYLCLVLYFNPIAEAMHWTIRQRDITPIVFAIVILSIAFTPAMSDVLRGAILAVPQGQYEAARSSGLTTVQMIRRVVLPQMIPAAIPNVTNMLIGIMKGSALAYSVGVTDVLNASLRDAASQYNIIEAYIAAALIYWALAVVIEKVMGALSSGMGRYRKAIA